MVIKKKRSQKINKKITILCLSGWGQDSKSLQPVFDNFGANYQLINFDYSTINSITSFFTQLQKLNINPEIIIGWSLGGQLAMRSILKKIFNPKLLILLSTPFKFVACPKVQTIMPKTTFYEFRDSFAKLPKHTLKRFMALMLLNDKKAKHNIKSLKDLYLEIDESNFESLLFWLEELGSFSCHNLNFKALPKTLIIHGSEDMVINVNQSKLLAKNIANSKLEIFNDCSHMPHLHNIEKLQSIIREQINESNL